MSTRALHWPLLAACRDVLWVSRRAVSNHERVLALGFGARANRFPGDMTVAAVEKSMPKLRKKILPAVAFRQREAWCRHSGVFLARSVAAWQMTAMFGVLSRPSTGHGAWLEA